LTKRHLFIHLAPLVILMTGLIIPAVSAAQSVAPVKKQEYFFRQAVSEDLLITINAFEAEFESKITGPNGEILLRSGIPGSRLVPVFQYISAPKTDRQIDIEVTSSLFTGRTEFAIELARLKPWDSRSSSVSQAYRLLSFGSEASASDSQANWTVKIDSLVNAGKLFEEFGMVEMRLWANYLAAHLIQFHLHDYSIVYSMTREILVDLKGSRFQKIELATLHLQGLALIGLRKAGSLSTPADNTDPVQAVLLRTAELADSMGYHFEQARALYASGVEYAEQSSWQQALEQFQRAVQLADSVAGAELATAIRESIVQIHTIQGDAPATSEVLQEIESQLVEDGGGDELALNMLAQARLLMDSYYWGEAFEILSGALNYENNSAIRTQINFELAKTSYEAGRLDESMGYLQLAGINPATAQNRPGNPVIDVAEGLRIMANIYRVKGEHEQMQKARNAQGQYQPPADQYLYEQGLDSIARAADYRREALSFFRQSHTAASTAGHVDMKHLARLQYCALAGSADDLCASLDASYESLRHGGVPRLSTEAMFLWAQIKDSAGQRGAALSVLEQLSGEMHLLRDSLAGVLGAWYVERHEQVFDTWLGMLIADSKQRGGAGDLDSLLALSKIRTIESYTGWELSMIDRSKATDPLRGQLAQRAKSAAGQSMLALNDNINAELETLRSGYRNRFGFLSDAGLQKYLRSLTHDETVLTYHISPAMAQVWVAHKGGVQRRDITNPAGVSKALLTARQGLENIGVVAFDRTMDELGKRLLEPVADLLSETVYLIPAGPLLGFPFDALRINGRYLAEKHSLVNLLSFPLNTDPQSSLKTGPLQKVFLAGNPQDYSGDYATRLETSPEIRSVGEIFIGPGLQIIQGVALLPDEFQSEYFLQSNLAHLSMPGLINLKYPFESGLELSEGEYEPGRMVLKPRDIRTQKLDAGLVFLSSTRSAGEPVSGYSHQPGLVSDFITAGARAVIVNLWPGDAESNETFISDFYRKLKVSGNIAESLQESRLKYLQKNRDDNLYDWAGYQLFIR
jgi:CHAT domain-containing protein/tetratricopeptide (TPR) repeat protein